MELWEVAQCSAERQTERGVGGGGAALWTGTHTHDGQRSACYGDRPVSREITADWVDDARRRLL